MNTALKKLLYRILGISSTPKGAYNFRINGINEGRAEFGGIQIINKCDKPGLNIIVEPGVKGEVIHIPVLIDRSGFSDLVYNDFHIGENCDIKIIAGCGIHNDGVHATQHSGIHTFYIGKGANVKYDEKHYGQGTGRGDKVLNPKTVIYLEEGGRMEMNSVQIEGVDETERITKAVLAEDASLITKELILTSGIQSARTDFKIELNGKNSSVSLVSRSVAKDKSKQYFYSVINGNNKCKGYSACDAIIMDQAMVKAVPDVTAKHVDAELIHEAAIGKIAGEQIIKLMSLGLSYEEAEEKIVAAFLS